MWMVEAVEPTAGGGGPGDGGPAGDRGEGRAQQPACGQGGLDSGIRVMGPLGTGSKAQEIGSPEELEGPVLWAVAPGSSLQPVVPSWWEGKAVRIGQVGGRWPGS